MKDVIIELMNSYGYLAIFIIILLENIIPIIPGIVILVFGGVMTLNSNLTILGVFLSSILGALIGSIIVYFVGKIFNKEKIKELTKTKIGKLFKIKPSDIEKADYWFDTKGNIMVLYARVIPVVRSIISIPAGMSEMPFIKFIIYSFIGHGIYNIILILLGYYAGDNFNYFLNVFHKVSSFIFVILLIFIAYFIYKFYKKKERRKKEK